jgi:tetratricopeptide (TPR) repeat protein
LAVALDMQVRTAEAEPIFRSLFETQQRVKGFDHWTTLGTANSLALVLTKLDRLNEARDLYERILEVRKRTAGPDHPQTLIGMSNLAEVLVKQKHFDEAAALYNDVLPRKQRVMGPNGQSTIRTIADMAVLESERGDFEKSAQHWEQVTQLAPKAFPQGHPILASFAFQSGITLLKLERYDQAEQHLLEAYQLASSAAGEDSSRAQRVARQVVTLYENWNKPAEAERWRGKTGAPATAATQESDV